MRTQRRFVPSILCLLMLAFSAPVRAQHQSAKKRTPSSICRADIYAAHRALPKLAYQCPEDLDESDDKLLHWPDRLAAITELSAQLKTFNDPRWWQASVDELNVCDFRGSAGILTAEEKGKLQSGDYLFQLFGNQQLRLVLISDPCYQSGYNGSILFLLNRNQGKVVVSQLIDGYYSRVDNSVGVALARHNGEEIIEVETANSMPPGMTFYYFRIDPVSGKALPKNLFRAEQKLTNVIYSALLFGKPADFGLPQSASELDVIRGDRLAPSFSAYEESEEGGIDDNGRKLRRITYRWNGRFYVRR